MCIAHIHNLASFRTYFWELFRLFFAHSLFYLDLIWWRTEQTVSSHTSHACFHFRARAPTKERFWTKAFHRILNSYSYKVSHCVCFAASHDHIHSPIQKRRSTNVCENATKAKNSSRKLWIWPRTDLIIDFRFPKDTCARRPPAKRKWIVYPVTGSKDNQKRK